MKRPSSGSIGYYSHDWVMKITVSIFPLPRIRVRSSTLPWCPINARAVKRTSLHSAELVKVPIASCPLVRYQ
jgi:hypothetical protein